VPSVRRPVGIASYRSAFQNWRFLHCDFQIASGVPVPPIGEAELDQATMSRVDQLLATVDVSAELEVIRYAA
jgi:hypothetical protein